MAKLTEYKDMNPRAKAVVEGIAKARGSDPANINNVWKALAPPSRHDGALRRGDEGGDGAGARSDGLTKELIYLAVSGGQPVRLLHSIRHRLHGAPEGHDRRICSASFMAVVLAAQKGNKIATAYRVPVDEAFEEK